MVDFLVECTFNHNHNQAPDHEKEQSLSWTLFVEGSSNAKGSGAGLILPTLNSNVLEYALQFGFCASNNKAEYKALLASLQLSKGLGKKCIRGFSDSQLVVNQVNREVRTAEQIQHPHRTFRSCIAENLLSSRKGYSWVISEHILDFLHQWQGTDLCKRGKVYWQSVAHAVLWGVWDEKNKCLFDNKFRPLEELISDITYLCNLWTVNSDLFKGLSVNDLNRDAHPFLFLPHLHQTTLRQPDPISEGVMTLKFDGSALGNPGLAGIGGIVRDEKGNICGTFSGPIGLADSTKAKVMAALTGIRIIKNLGILNLIIAGDSANTIKWLRDKEGELGD
ncbi:PREDICTED: uncharacterized protein LOC109115059 [Nelumbo nucifera]|uniref:Uncharacterized protein LOC109115059 n=1 Tax=Nelumbo nucifera TaxID=4432 RepID=A0A1U8Q838_NELNU|nr:PREDICTED: uncharacterized protein LOC109115059 [Nelumbo nucifera]